MQIKPNSNDGKPYSDFIITKNDEIIFKHYSVPELTVGNVADKINACARDKGIEVPKRFVAENIKNNTVPGYLFRRQGDMYEGKKASDSDVRIKVSCVDMYLE